MPVDPNHCRRTWSSHWLVIGLLAALGAWIGALQLAPFVLAAEPAADGQLDMAPFQQLVRSVIVHELKDKYEDKHNWGHTTQVERLRVKGKWFEPRVEKHQVEVNDGLWQRAVITLVEPEKNLRTRLTQEPAPAPGVSAFVLQLGAKLSGEAHIERWRKGIKMLNTSVLFDADVRARIHCRLSIRREPGKLIDDVVLDPRVTAVELELVDFELNKLGVLGRDVARELSDPLKPLIARELERRQGKIVEKANAAIDKQRSKLRFSASDFLTSEWSKLSAKLSGSEPSEAKPK